MAPKYWRHLHFLLQANRQVRHLFRGSNLGENFYNRVRNQAEVTHCIHILADQRQTIGDRSHRRIDDSMVEMIAVKSFLEAQFWFSSRCSGFVYLPTSVVMDSVCRTPRTHGEERDVSISTVRALLKSTSACLLVIGGVTRKGVRTTLKGPEKTKQDPSPSIMANIPG